MYLVNLPDDLEEPANLTIQVRQHRSWLSWHKKDVLVRLCNRAAFPGSEYLL